MLLVCTRSCQKDYATSHLEAAAILHLCHDGCLHGVLESRVTLHDVPPRLWEFGLVNYFVKPRHLAFIWTLARPVGTLLLQTFPILRTVGNLIFFLLTCHFIRCTAVIELAFARRRRLSLHRRCHESPRVPPRLRRATEREYGRPGTHL